MKLGKKEVILGLWMLFLVLGNILWLSLDKNPPAWDQAAHLRGIANANFFLRGNFEGGFVKLLNSFWGYPPLIYFMGGFWSLFSGLGVGKITVLNSLFLLWTLIGVYKLSGKKIIAPILFSLFPVIYDISRNMLLDLALTGWVVWGLYFWLKRNDLRWLLMLVLASLTKINGFIYFLPMVLISVGENYKHKQFWLRAVTGLMIYLALVTWWWKLNWQAIYQYLTGLAGQGESLTDPMNLLSLTTWIHYLRLFFLQQVGPIAGLILGINLFWIDFKEKKNKKLLWWLLLSYVIFTVIRNKDFRFTMPLLPVIALWFGEGLEKIKQKWLILFLLLWLGFNYVENSFNWPFKKPVVLFTPTFLMRDVNWINFSDYPVREYRTNKWPNEKILLDLPKGARLLTVVNTAEINDNNLQFYKLILGINETQIHGIDRWGEMKFDYVLVPDMKTESAPFYDVQLSKRKEIIEEAWNNPRNYQIEREYGLPNGGKVFLLKVV